MWTARKQYNRLLANLGPCGDFMRAGYVPTTWKVQGVAKVEFVRGACV